MYQENDKERLLEFMRRFSFAVVVSVSEGRPVATHLPLTVKVEGDLVLLRGHFAKANPQWRDIEGSEVLAVFNGPHAYVSPRHYDAFESVPTWNYLAVHAYGEARVSRDPAANEELLYELIGANEPGYRDRWEQLPERYREGMLRGIVGFELRVTRLEGKAKLSQNKTEEERRRIAEALASSEDPVERATGEEMARREAERI
jgi:transcriptional regulator